jgi:OPA family glycerol-3-phosphate transporter-like MFS transporter
MYSGIVGLFLLATIVVYFFNNPLGHNRPFMVRRFINWFPLGMTYAFLCMGRFNLIVAKGALGTLMSKEDFGIIFFAGTVTYALSFLVNGPLIDKKFGGKNGMLIAAAGSSLANISLGALTYMVVTGRLHMRLVVAFSAIYSLNMYFQSFGAMSIMKVKSYWFHVRERGVFGAIFGTLISIGAYFAFDWSAAIISAAKVNGAEGWLHNLMRGAFGFGMATDATWAVFLVPAVILLVWVAVDIWLIKDTPEQAGFPYLDTCDASSGHMGEHFTAMQLLAKIFASPLMLMIASVELASGVFRYSITQWYLTFAAETKMPGSAFFSDHWGFLQCVFGILGGFTGGIVSDRLFQSRRGPPAAMLCGLVLVLAVVMQARLSTSAAIVGWSAISIVMASIGITSLMSGTAAMDFGGRTATATCMGVVDGFAYVGCAIQSLGLGDWLIPAHGWKAWPAFMIPFAIIGTVIAVKLWHALPAATKKFLVVVEHCTKPI